MIAKRTFQCDWPGCPRTVEIHGDHPDWRYHCNWVVYWLGARGDVDLCPDHGRKSSREAYEAINGTAKPPPPERAEETPMPDSPDHAARILAILNNTNHASWGLFPADVAALRWLWGERERLVDEARRFYRPDGSYQYLDSPQEVIDMRIAAAAEIVEIRAEVAAARAEVERLTAARTIDPAYVTIAAADLAALRRERDEAKAAVSCLCDLNTGLSDGMVREVLRGQKAERERDALIRSRVHHYASRPDAPQWIASEHTGCGGQCSWHATEAEAVAAVRKAAGLDSGGPEVFAKDEEMRRKAERERDDAVTHFLAVSEVLAGVEVQRDAYKHTLEYIAHFDSATMNVARTLHYDMAGAARIVLETGKPPTWRAAGLDAGEPMETRP